MMSLWVELGALRTLIALSTVALTKPLASGAGVTVVWVNVALLPPGFGDVPKLRLMVPAAATGAAVNSSGATAAQRRRVPLVIYALCHGADLRRKVRCARRRARGSCGWPSRRRSTSGRGGKPTREAGF